MGGPAGCDEVTLPGTASSGPVARHFVEDMVTRWGAEELVWAAALCVSELAANAALHARTSFTVRVSSTGAGAVRLEVEDGSPRAPVLRDYGTSATTGRGLQLVAALAHEWGVERSASGAGKTVWLELRAEDGGARAEAEVADDVDVDALLAAFDEGDDRLTSARVP